jgi:hypothetical protein
MGSGNAKCGNENVKYEDILYEKLDHQKKTDLFNKFKTIYADDNIDAIYVHQEIFTKYYVIYITSSSPIYFDSKSKMIQFVLQLKRPFIYEKMLGEPVLCIRFVYF